MDIFLQQTTAHAAQELVGQGGASDRGSLKAKLDAYLDEYLTGHDDDLKRFVRERLVDRFTQAFVNELKNDDRAWRATQLQAQKGLHAQLADLNTSSGQELPLLRELVEWKRKLDSTPPAERDPLGQDTLNTLEDKLKQALAEQTDVLTETIRNAADQTVARVGELLQPGSGTSPQLLEGYLRAHRTYCDNLPYVGLSYSLSGAGTQSIDELYVPLSVRGLHRRQPANDDSEASDPTSPTSLYTDISVPQAIRSLVGNIALPHLFITGDAGAGKSTLLRYVAKRVWDAPAEVGFDKPYLPMVLRARWLGAVEGLQIEDRLRAALDRAGEIAQLEPIPQGFFAEWPKQADTRWVLFLDGLDEVPDPARHRFLRWLNSLIDVAKESIAHIVMTSRPSTNLSAELEARFQHCKVLPFTALQETDLARKLLGDQYHEFVTQLDRLEITSQEPRTIGSTRPLINGAPLLITVAANVYSKSGQLPIRRTELYRQFIDTWLSEAREHGLATEIEESLVRLSSKILERLAFSTSDQPQFDTVLTLSPIVAAYLRQTLNLSEDLAEVTAEQVIQVLGRRSGVLFCKDGICEWIHPTFREYLAARVLHKQLNESHSDYERILDGRPFTSQWDGAVEMLRELLAEPQELDSWLQSQRLAVIADGKQRIERRQRCLRTIGINGYKDASIVSALQRCFETIPPADIELLSNALWAALRLRELQYGEHAAVALASDDWETVDRAASYLSHSPSPGALSTLRAALHRWQFVEEEDSRTLFLLPSLLTALAKLNLAEAHEIIIHSLETALRGSGNLSEVEALWAADYLNLAAAHGLVLETLLLSLEDGGLSDGKVFQALTRIERTWRPELLRALVDARRRLDSKGRSVAQRLVEPLVEKLAPAKLEIRMDAHNQIPILYTLAVCQAPDFVPQLGRLLHNNVDWMKRKIAEAFWVLGDPGAEAFLLDEVEEASKRNWEGTRDTIHDIIRALGTCATSTSAEAIMRYLYSSPEIELHIPEEAIVPLLTRGVLDANRLQQLVRDNTASEEGRNAALIAIGYFSPKEQAQLCREILAKHDRSDVFHFALTVAGWTRDRSLGDVLHHALRTTTDSRDAERAARSLALINYQPAVHDIERALGKFTDSRDVRGFAFALSRFKRKSSLPVLLDVLARNRWDRETALLEALGVYWPQQQVRETYAQTLNSPSAAGVVFALSTRDPNFLLRRSLDTLENRPDEADVDLRKALAVHIVKIAKHHDTDVAMLVELLAWLICDRELDVREKMNLQLRRLAPELLNLIYAWLHANTDEWTRACIGYSLGFWDAQPDRMSPFLGDGSPLVRKLAEEATLMREKHTALRGLVKQFNSVRKMPRLSSYLCLKAHADMRTVRELAETRSSVPFLDLYVAQLLEDVQDRLKKERKEREENESKLMPGNHQALDDA
ncbi:MAG TPA: NACHT domain-containing protein [Chloroflexia bacterium]|nr:NACHT domain-containing protein [Chloroflexia bacterium]